MDFKKVLDLLKCWKDIHNTDCRFDHHGYCQAHYLQLKDECIVMQTRAFIKELESEILNGRCKNN